VEEFVSGTEVGGDAIIIDCRVAFIAITHKHLRGFVVTGHSLPTNIPAEAQSRVIQHIEAVCTALGYRHGALNFDAISSENSVTILEMSPRNGGNGLPAVIDRATGVDVEEAAIRLALGEIPDFPYHVGVKRSAGSFVFGSQAGGKLRRIRSPEELQRQVPEVFDVHYVCRPGDTVAPFEHNGNLIGYVLFDCLDAVDYERMTEKISDSLDISVCSE
jgi:biotin carboxylase